MSGKRGKAVVTLLLVAGMSLVTAAQAEASELQLCYVAVTDDTPGTYPGGMHVTTNCLSR